MQIFWISKLDDLNTYDAFKIQALYMVGGHCVLNES